MNTFVTEVSDLIGREKDIAELRRRIEDGEQIAVLGVEGVGKTTLVRSALSREYRMKMAEQKGLLISALTEFPSDIESGEIYLHFISMMESSVRILGQIGKAAEMEDILSQLKGIKNGEDREFTKYQAALSLISDTFGYRVVFAVDNFDNFTASAKVTMDHHGVMREMLGKSKFLVVSNYDLNKDSLPAHVKGSYLLMTFSGGVYPVKALDSNTCYELVSDRLRGLDLEVSEELKAKLYSVTGGIPALLLHAVNKVGAYLASGGREEELSLFNEVYLDDYVQKLLERWCVMLTGSQVKVLKAIVAEGDFKHVTELESAAQMLYKRGVLIRADDIYKLNCKFLGSFVSEGDRLDKATCKNPFAEENGGEDDAPLKALAKLISNSDLDRAELIKVINEVLTELTGTSKVVDFTESLSAEAYSELSIPEEALNDMLPEMKAMLEQGMQMRATFKDSGIHDYSPVYIMFCKALEAQMEQTLFQVMQAALGDTYVELHGRSSQFKYVNPPLELGTLHHVLDGENGTYNGKNCKLVSEFLERNDIRDFPMNFFNKYLETLDDMAVFRNKCCHERLKDRPMEPVSDEEGKEFLKKLFYPTSKSFFNRTNKMYKLALDKGAL